MRLSFSSTRSARRLRTVGLAALASIGTWVSPVNGSADSVEFAARFTPDRLGASTTILVRFAVSAGGDAVPSPVREFSLRLPHGMGFGSTTLGLAVCSPSTLETFGLGACSPNSFMGFGRAEIEASVGATPIREPIDISTLMAPATDGHTAIDFYATGSKPLLAGLVFPGLLLAQGGPGSRAHIDLDMFIPPVAAWPGGPETAIAELESSFGPAGLTYYRHRHGRTVPYRPSGPTVPVSCPRGGFAVTGTFVFEDGTTAAPTAHVPCPVGGPVAKSPYRNDCAAGAVESPVEQGRRSEGLVVPSRGPRTQLREGYRPFQGCSHFDRGSKKV